MEVLLREVVKYWFTIFLQINSIVLYMFLSDQLMKWLFNQQLQSSSGNVNSIKFQTMDMLSDHVFNLLSNKI